MEKWRRVRWIVVILMLLTTGVLGYLQFGRDVEAMSSCSQTSENGYILEVTLSANRLCIMDEEAFSREIIERCVENTFREIRFSYDVRGYPNELQIDVYRNGLDFRNKKLAFQIYYVQDAGYVYNIREHPEKFTVEIEHPPDTSE